jgi:hypothetical protein
MEINTNTVREVESLDVHGRMVMRNLRDENLWYGTVAPDPSGIKQKLITWAVGKFTPEWSLVAASHTVEVPFSVEEIGDAFLARIYEVREKYHMLPSNNVTLLRFIGRGEEDEES